MARGRIELMTLALLAPRSADWANGPRSKEVVRVGSTWKFYAKQQSYRFAADSNLVSRIPWVVYGNSTQQGEERNALKHSCLIIEAIAPTNTSQLYLK